MTSNKPIETIKDILKIEDSVPLKLGHCVYWRLPNGQWHRKHGPALEHEDGHREWYLNGKRYRDDGPAIEYENGDKEWYLNGKLHREDGPAIERVNGYKAWYFNGQAIEEITSRILFLLSIAKVRYNIPVPACVMKIALTLLDLLIYAFKQSFFSQRYRKRLTGS